MMFTKFTHKPTMARAIRVKDVLDYPHSGLPEEIIDAQHKGDIKFYPCELHVKTKNGVVNAKATDWLILNDAGEFYPCSPEIFIQSYRRCNEINVKGTFIKLTKKDGTPAWIDAHSIGSLSMAPEGKTMVDMLVPSEYYTVTESVEDILSLIEMAK